MEIGDKLGDLEIISIDRQFMASWKQPRTRVRVTTRCICGTTKEYDLHGLKSYGQKKCAKCVRNHGQSKSKEYQLWSHAKRRARDAGLPFDIDWRDITIPEICPLLEIPIIASSKTSDNSPSLDRIICHKGYVKGNVMVISHKANRIKSNATIDEINLLCENFHKAVLAA
jgi:hypothetical protein